MTPKERAAAFIMHYPLMFTEDFDFWTSALETMIIQAEATCLSYELDSFCRFAEKWGYMDSDWYAEKPTLIARYKAHVAKLK